MDNVEDKKKEQKRKWILPSVVIILIVIVGAVVLNRGDTSSIAFDDTEASSLKGETERVEGQGGGNLITTVSPGLYPYGFEGNRFCDNNGLCYQNMSNGFFRVFNNDEMLRNYGFAITSDQLNKSVMDFEWDWTFDESTDVWTAEYSDANFVWKQIFDFNNGSKMKITHYIENNWQDLTGVKIWYLATVNGDEEVIFNEEEYYMDIDRHKTTELESFNDSQYHFDFEDDSFNFADVFTDFELTDMYVGNASFIGFPNQRILGVAFSTRTDGGNFNLGKNVTIDPEIESDTDKGEGGQEQSFQNHVFYNKNNNRWYAIYLDSQKIRAASANITNISDWILPDATIGSIEEGGNWDYDDYDAVYNWINDSTAYIHVVFSLGAQNTLRYRRILLENIPGGNSDYMTTGGSETIFDSAQQATSGDHADRPRAEIDKDNCLWVAFDLEDQSEPSADQHEVWITKEVNNLTSVCGDGNWNLATDTDSNFPIEDIQDNGATSAWDGQDSDRAIGITYDQKDYMFAAMRFDDDVLITRVNVTDGSIINLGGREDVNTIEFSTTWSGYAMSSEPGGIVVVAIEDNTQDLHSWYDLDTSSLFMSSGADIGNAYDASTYSMPITLTSTNVSGTWEHFVVWVNTTANTQIQWSNSTDGGVTWDTPKTFEAQSTSSALDQSFYLSSDIDEENCMLGVRWLKSTGSPWEVMFDVVNITGCVADPVPDTTDPVIQLNAPTNGSTVTNETVTFNATSIDNVNTSIMQFHIWNGSANPAVLLNTTNTSTSGSNVSVIDIFQLPHDGTYFWNYLGYDNASMVNVGMAEANFTLIYNDPGADSCTCAGLNNDWQIDHSDSCNIIIDCFLGTGYLNFTGTGTTTCNATVNTTNLGDPGDGGIFEIQDSCLINVI